MVGPSESGNFQLIYEWLTNGTFQPKFDKIDFVYQYYQSLYDKIQKEIDCIELVKGVNFELIDSLKNNRTKYLLIFDDSCEEVCSPIKFFKIATTGRHRGLSTIYIKHNLFHKSTLGRDIELQTTHIALFKSPRDVIQINTLSTQLGLGSSLVDWYRDATSVPFGHLLSDLSPRTDDNGETPTKFYVPESLKHLTTLDDEHTKYLYSPRVPIIFQHLQKTSSPIVSKRIYSASKRRHSKHTPGKLAKRKKTSRFKHEQELHLLALKRTTLKQRRDLLTSERGLQRVDIIPQFFNNYLS